jgi:outer membrane lipoprotein SlyB
VDGSVIGPRLGLHSARMMTIRHSPWWVLLLATLTACAAQRPVLYPNAQLTKVGDAAAQRDVDDCMQRAQQFISSGGTHATQVAKTTGTGTAAGAAIGAVGGAITGNAGQGAAVGAATGATAGLLTGLLRSSAPDPVYAAFVDRCLRERGYDPIGWK